MPFLTQETTPSNPSMDSTLLEIARSGDVGYLNQIADDLLLQSTSRGNTALHEAARLGHNEFAGAISSRCPSLLEAQNSRGDTPLHLAARAGWKTMVDLLIHRTNSIQDGRAVQVLEIPNIELNTALHEAAWKGHSQVVHLLIREAPGMVSTPNKAGQSPLYLAAERGSRPTVDSILQTTPAGSEHSGWHNRNPLHAAVIGGHSGKVLQIT